MVFLPWEGRVDIVKAPSMLTILEDVFNQVLYLSCRTHAEVPGYNPQLHHLKVLVEEGNMKAHKQKTAASLTNADRGGLPRRQLHTFILGILFCAEEP